MKLCASGLKLFAGILCLALLPCAAFGAGAVVDCSGATPPPAFISINAALASLPKAGPNSISVVGTCQENVLIVGFTDLTIFGNPSATVKPGDPNRRLLNIFASQRIEIQNLTFDGGLGVVVHDNSRADFTNITIQNSSVPGLTSLDSVVHIADSTIQNNTRSGISVSGGTFFVDSDVTGTTVSGNGRNGIVVLTGHLVLNGGDGVTPGTQNVFSNNGLIGVAVENSAEADVNGDNRIEGNHGQFGVVVVHTSSLLMSDGSISNNSGVGVHCGETSHCEWSGATKIDNNGNGGIAIVDHSDAYLDGGIDVSGNTHNGVYADLSSLYNSLGGNTINNNTGDGVLLEAMAVAHYTGNDTMTGNASSPLECDTTSLVVGDVASLGKIKCKNVQPQSPTQLTSP